MEDTHFGWKQILFTAVVGAIYSVGCALQSPVTPWRVAVGRAITTAVLTMSASVLLALYPSAPEAMIYGAAAGLAVMGTAGLERIVGRVVGVKAEA